KLHHLAHIRDHQRSNSTSSLIDNMFFSFTQLSRSYATIHAHAQHNLAHTQQFTLMHYKLSLICYNLRSCTTKSSSSATIYAHTYHMDTKNTSKVRMLHLTLEVLLSRLSPFILLKYHVLFVSLHQEQLSNIHRQYFD